jgi:hypothetical protein
MEMPMQRSCRFLLLCAAAVLAGAAPAGAVPVDDATFMAVVAGMAPGKEAAFPVDAGTMADLDALDALVDPASGWDGKNAAAGDDPARIAATACTDGVCRAARSGAVPAVPQPSVLALLGGALALLGWRRRQAWGFTPLAPRCPG